MPPSRAALPLMFAQGGRPILQGEPQPQHAYVELSDAPGFGYDLDQEILSGRAAAALIY